MRELTKLPKGEIKLADGRVLYPYEHPNPMFKGQDIFFWATDLEAMMVLNCPADEKVRTPQEEFAYYESLPKPLLKRALDCFSVGASNDETAHGVLFHVSFSYPAKLPNYKDIQLVKLAFFDTDRDAMMVFPREEIYFNVHKTCLHLYEVPERWEVDKC